MGAPKGNTNRAIHGLRGSRLPRGCGYIAKEVSKFRRSLEAAVSKRNREAIDLVTAAKIDAAARWHTHALLASRWLRREGEGTDAAEQLRFSRAAAVAAAKRNRIVAELVPKQDPLATLYSRSPESAWDS